MKSIPAPDVQLKLADIIETLELDHVSAERLHCMRTQGARTRAYARIWSLPSIWRQALSQDVAYIIEVISERYDELSLEDQERVLIHELMHIPAGFSGGLVPHLCAGRRINSASVERLHREYSVRKKERVNRFSP